MGMLRPRTWIEGDSPVIVIVRPDSFIGAIVTSAEGVERYFSKILVH